MKHGWKIAAFCGVVALLEPGSASANVIITQTNAAFANDSNVIFNACPAGIGGPATTVTGCLNDDQSYVVEFTGAENLLFGGGQARVTSNDQDGFSALSVTTAEGSFATFITNINASNFTNGNTTGTVRITPYIGGISQGDFDYSIAEAGQNFFSFSTDNGDLFTKIDFLALGTNDVVFADFRQNRIGPAPDSPTAVFEPASLPLFAMALGGLFFAARRRKLPMAQCGTDLLI